MREEKTTLFNIGDRIRYSKTVCTIRNISEYSPLGHKYYSGLSYEVERDDRITGGGCHYSGYGNLYVLPVGNYELVEGSCSITDKISIKTNDLLLLL